jgi:hypothetical protein
MHEHLVRQLIRRKLIEGRLPRSRAFDVWVLPGDGQTCDGCEKSIEDNTETARAIATRNGLPLRFHEDCYRLWESERESWL